MCMPHIQRNAYSIKSLIPYKEHITHNNPNLIQGITLHLLNNLI